VTAQKAEIARRRWSLAVTAASGDEVLISLHPVSLARLLAEVIEDAAQGWCKRRGHVEGPEGFCHHCGVHLPDDSPYNSWLPDAYRTIRKPRTGRGTSSGGDQS
jgi:hypothetical protein